MIAIELFAAGIGIAAWCGYWVGRFDERDRF
jgi:hypothetical protein